MLLFKPFTTALRFQGQILMMLAAYCLLLLQTVINVNLIRLARHATKDGNFISIMNIFAHTIPLYIHVGEASITIRVYEMNFTWVKPTKFPPFSFP